MSDGKYVVVQATGGPEAPKPKLPKVPELQEEIVEKSNPLPTFSANKPVYLVDILYGHQKWVFVAQKLDHKPATLKLTGYKIDNPLETIDNLKDAEKHANRAQIYDIEFPWHRILSIRNITYQTKG